MWLLALYKFHVLLLQVIVRFSKNVGEVSTRASVVWKSCVSMQRWLYDRRSEHCDADD